MCRSGQTALCRGAETLQPLTLVARLTTLGGYFGLLALLTAKFTLLEAAPGFPVALSLLILVGPLLLPLRGLLQGRPRSHVWACFLSLFYFSAGVFSAAGDSARPLIPAFEIALSVLLFLGALLFVRSRNHEIDALEPANGMRRRVTRRATSGGSE